MEPKRLKNGNLLVPMRAESSDGTIGDAMIEIKPEDPSYDKWAKYMRSQQLEQLKSLKALKDDARQLLSE
jgi:hypothetical protein